MSDTVPPADAAAPSPYPTVQILQAAMAHRESIRSSFESQRAALTEAIAAQRQAVNQAVANTRQSSGSRSGTVQLGEGASNQLQTEAGIGIKDPGAVFPVGMDSMPPGEKLLTALTLLTAPEAASAKISVAQRAMITREFFEALKLVIADEVAGQIRKQPALPDSGETGDIENGV